MSILMSVHMFIHMSCTEPTKLLPSDPEPLPSFDTVFSRHTDSNSDCNSDSDSIERSIEHSIESDSDDDASDGNSGGGCGIRGGDASGVGGVSAVSAQSSAALLRHGI